MEKDKTRSLYDNLLRSRDLPFSHSKPFPPYFPLLYSSLPPPPNPFSLLLITPLGVYIHTNPRSTWLSIVPIQIRQTKNLSLPPRGPQMDGGSETSGGGRRRRGKRREELRRFECLSPRSLLSRWFSSSEEKVRRESRREGVGREVAQVGCSMEGLNGESSSCVLGLRRESHSHEASGNGFEDHLPLRKTTICVGGNNLDSGPTTMMVQNQDFRYGSWPLLIVWPICYCC